MIVQPPGSILGDVCHIKGEKRGAARYDSAQTAEDRSAFENLILLCKNHHKTVDDDPARFTVERLREIKDRHERNGDIELSQDAARLASILYNSISVTIRSGRDSLVMVNSPGSVQAINVFNKLPIIQKVIERREGSLTSEECRQVQAWIESLAEETVGVSRQQAYRMWWTRFKSAMVVEKYEELASARMSEAERWYRIQRAELTRGLKSKAPDEWRRKLIGAIKAAMCDMGVTKEQYYPDVACRLRMKKPFVSLNDLTKRDMARIYTMALRDAKKL